MTKCKIENCNNNTTTDQKYCKYHQSKKEENRNLIVKTSLTLMAFGIAFVKKIK